jgi:flagellar biosynthesis/type III secretory pathway M-ring protein FliF/YscJ
MAEQSERPPAEVTEDASTAAAGTGLKRRLRAVWPWAVAAGAVAIAVGLWAAGSTRAGGRTAPELLEDMRRGAREREIARMITTLHDVRSAKVLLRDGTPRRASVTLELCGGAALSPETASAVAGLVASAAPGLDAHEVVVVDSRDPGRTHRLSPDSEFAYRGAAVLRLRRDVERALADKLRALFAGMSIECVAVVSAELDLDRVEEKVLTLDPEGKGEVILSEERGAPSASGSTRGQTRKIEAEVSRITQEISRAPKGLASVKASVVLFDRVMQDVDGTWKYERIADKDLDNYRALAGRALGLDDEEIKNKTVEVQYLKSPWAKPPVADAEPRLFSPPARAVAKVVIVAVAVALIAAFALGRLVRRRPAEVEPPPAPVEPESGPLSVEDLKAEVASSAAEDVERTAAILRRWIAQEG